MSDACDVRFHDDVLTLKIEKKGFKEQHGVQQQRWGLVLLNKNGKRELLSTSVERQTLERAVAAAANAGHYKGQKVDPFHRESSVWRGLKAMADFEHKKAADDRKEKYASAASSAKLEAQVCHGHSRACAPYRPPCRALCA